MILRNIEGRRTIAASSFFPDRSRLATRRSYSLEKAKEYLKKSTYNGETIHIYFFAFKDSANDAYFLKERCESLGIQVALHPFPVSDYMDRSIDKHADIIFMGEVFAANHEIAFLNVFKNKSCFVNRFIDPHYENKLTVY